MERESKKLSEADRALLAWWAVSALRIAQAQRRTNRREVRRALGLVVQGPYLAEGERAGYFAALGLL